MSVEYDTIINFSGGLDSTYCLYKWLKDNPASTGKQVLVHHCMLKSPRTKFEQKAVLNILRYLQQHSHSNFKYIQTEFSWGNSPKESDIGLIGFITTSIMRKIQVNSITICASKFDMQQGQAYEDRSRRRHTIIESILGYKPVYVYPIKDMSRMEMFADLPQPIKNYLWYCRRPIGEGKTCGVCTPCKAMASGQ